MSTVKNELHDTIKKLLKGKPENNFLFFHCGKFWVSRKGNLQVLSNDSVNQLCRINDDIEIWRLCLLKNEETEPIPSFLQGKKYLTVTASDNETFDVLMKLLGG